MRRHSKSPPTSALYGTATDTLARNLATCTDKGVSAQRTPHRHPHFAARSPTTSPETLQRAPTRACRHSLRSPPRRPWRPLPRSRAPSQTDEKCRYGRRAASDTGAPFHSLRPNFLLTEGAFRDAKRAIDRTPHLPRGTYFRCGATGSGPNRTPVDTAIVPLYDADTDKRLAASIRPSARQKTRERKPPRPNLPFPADRAEDRPRPPGLRT